MSRPWTVMGRLPLTSALVVAILALSVVTRTLWDPLLDQQLRASAAYGLPAFDEGRWWTVATGAFFAARPVQYVSILVGLVVFGGFAEWRLGTPRYAIALVTAHVVGVVGAAGLLWLTRDHGYAWTTSPAHGVDAGPTAGFLGAAAAASVTLTPPWRGRLRTGLVTAVVLLAMHLGSLADVEHLIAVAWGLALGPMLLGRAPSLTARQLTRRDYRLLASGFFLIAAVEVFLQPFTTAEGPWVSLLSEQGRAEALADQDLIPAVIQAVLWLWLARLLYKGRRRAWRWAVGLLVVVMGIQVAGLVIMAVSGEQGLLVAAWELSGNGLGLAVLLAGRRAFRNPSPRRARRTTGSLIAPADDEQRSHAAALLRQYGTVNRLAWMTTWPENRWFESAVAPGFIAYRLHAGVAIGLCEPVAASAAHRSALLKAFADAVHAQGLVP